MVVSFNSVGLCAQTYPVFVSPCMGLLSWQHYSLCSCFLQCSSSHIYPELAYSQQCCSTMPTICFLSGEGEYHT
jgi:hypothetical protein